MKKQDMDHMRFFNCCLSVVCKDQSASILLLFVWCTWGRSCDCQRWAQPKDQCASTTGQQCSLSYLDPYDAVLFPFFSCLCVVGVAGIPRNIFCQQRPSLSQISWRKRGLDSGVPAAVAASSEGRWQVAALKWLLGAVSHLVTRRFGAPNVDIYINFEHSLVAHQTIRAKSLDPTYQGRCFLAPILFKTGCQTGIFSLQFLGVTTSKTCWKHQLRWIRSPGRQAKKTLREESTPRVVFPYLWYIFRISIYNQIVLDLYHRLSNKQQHNAALGSYPYGFKPIWFDSAQLRFNATQAEEPRQKKAPFLSELRDVPWHPISQKQSGHTGWSVSENVRFKRADNTQRSSFLSNHLLGFWKQYP